MVKIGFCFENVKSLSSKLPKFGRQNLGSNLRYLKGFKIFNNKKFSNFHYCFPIYNCKLHDICSTSNLMHPPFNLRNYIVYMLLKQRCIFFCKIPFKGQRPTFKWYFTLLNMLYANSCNNML